MAKNGSKTDGKFKAGNPGGPGRPPSPPELKESRKFNRQEFELILTKFLQMTPEQLRTVKENKESTMLELIIHSIVVNSANKGDQVRLNFLIENIVGKLKESVDHSGGITVTVEDYTK